MINRTQERQIQRQNWDFRQEIRGKIKGIIDLVGYSTAKLQF